MKIKLMTFNVMHFENIKTKLIEYDKIIKLIKDNDIDIIGLNEVFGKGYDKNISMDQASYIANKLGYYCYFGKATYINFHKYGNAIISKYPLIDPQTYIIPTPFIKKGNKLYEKRCIIKTKIDIDGLLNVCICHFGLNEDEQIRALTKLYSLIDNNRFVMMGDFNIEPNNIILEPLRQTLTDTSSISKEELRTFPSMNPNRKIDYIWVSKDVNPLASYTVDDIISDHKPIITEIELIKHY